MSVSAKPSRTANPSQDICPRMTAFTASRTIVALSLCGQAGYSQRMAFHCLCKNPAPPLSRCRFSGALRLTWYVKDCYSLEALKSYLLALVGRLHMEF